MTQPAFNATRRGLFIGAAALGVASLARPVFAAKPEDAFSTKVPNIPSPARC